MSDELTYTSTTLMQSASDAILYQLTMSIRPAEINTQLAAEFLQSKVLSDNYAALVPYTYYLVSKIPLVKGAHWGDENGNYIITKKENDGSVTNEIYSQNNAQITHAIIKYDTNGKVIQTISVPENNYDPRQRPWYTEAKKQKQAIWTDIYLFHFDNLLGVSSGAPVYDANNQLRGVFGLDFSLEYLKHFVNNQVVSKNGYAFIISANEDLIAYPERAPFLGLAQNQHGLINVHPIHLPLIDASIDHYKKYKQQQFQFEYNNKTYLVSYQPVPYFNSQQWLVGIIIPRSDFTGFLQHLNLLTLIVSFIVLAIGIVIVSNLITRIVKPINLLVKETENIKNFDLDHVTPIDSRIKEVVLLNSSINSMKRGLKQFQKYVPKILVRQLLESHQDIEIGGERKRLVVLFTDIENFTTIAEEVDANDLMLQVCEYFEAITQIIMAHKGTIDKYIGDSIMAFWGAPLIENDPCERAANAALQCEEQILKLNANWQKQGKPVFITRIGIHVGEAIVGNLGSSERLSYTAIGDTINIASRLENINKNYATKIIVSAAVYAEINEKFNLRLLDSVVVTGRVKPIKIYELVGVK